MFKSFPILRSNSHRPLYRFAIHVERTLLPPIFIQLDINHLPAIITIVKPDIDIQRGREEVRHWKRSGREFPEAAVVVDTAAGDVSSLPRYSSPASCRWPQFSVRVTLPRPLPLSDSVLLTACGQHPCHRSTIVDNNSRFLSVRGLDSAISPKKKNLGNPRKAEFHIPTHPGDVTCSGSSSVENSPTWVVVGKSGDLVQAPISQAPFCFCRALVVTCDVNQHTYVPLVRIGVVRSSPHHVCSPDVCTASTSKW